MFRFDTVLAFGFFDTVERNQLSIFTATNTADALRTAEARNIPVRSRSFCCSRETFFYFNEMASFTPKSGESLGPRQVASMLIHKCCSICMYLLCLHTSIKREPKRMR